MFKIESYVTPILLSYVDKYVRDFKPADAQVSLWGGGVALHNLVLKADVLQQELALPFTLVSGRIHELLIQVPWTKIMSEPIIVTIDTIECVLSLNPPLQSEESLPPDSPRRAQVVEAPPGYMQALVRRIVSNISLRVHHLIVKYVQDDIVLSLNVKHLAVDSAGPDWEPAFADIDQNLPVIRRLVQLDDLTLCLDKADSDGKIRFYQEPLLYRCQLELRVLTRLVSANTRRASSLSVQLRSNKLAWGVTSDQLSLLLRLMRERPVVKMQQPTTKTVNSNQPPPHQSATSLSEPARIESWSEWAWSWLPMTSDAEGGIEEERLPRTPTPLHFNAYFDEISLVYKIMDLESSGRKRSRGILELFAYHGVVKSYVCRPTSFRVRMATRTMAVRSHGRCVCGHLDNSMGKDEPSVYICKADSSENDTWSWPESEFNGGDIETAEVAQETTKDDQSPEPNTNESDESDPSTPEHKKDIEDDKLWEQMTPLFYIQYTHERSPPDMYDNPYENPPEDFQYSDWAEESILKIEMEPLDIKISSGLLHRLSALTNVYKELPPVPDVEIPMRVLTVEECDALFDNLPLRRFSIEMKGLKVRLYPFDHSIQDRLPSTPVVLEVYMPKGIVIVSGPLYPHRVCSAACQMPDDMGPLWQGARVHISAVLSGVQANICSVDAQPRPCARIDLRVVAHSLQYRDFFTKRESVVFSYSVKMREVNLSGSAARLQTAWMIPMSLINEKMAQPLRQTTLSRDALNDQEAVALDVTLEDLCIRGYLTKHINTHILTLQCARATAMHEPKDVPPKLAWLFSGPDTPTTSPYLRIAVQWCSQPISNSLDYIGVWMEQTAVVIDPLFVAWLAYRPRARSYETPSHASLSKSSSSQYYWKRKATPPSSSGRGVSRSGSGAELVHVRPRSVGSSSEPSEKKEKQPVTPVKEPIDWFSGERLLAIHSRLRGMLVNVEVGLMLIYVTTSTVSAINCFTVRDAMERHAGNSQPVLAVSSGRFLIHSSLNSKQTWHEIRHDGPTFIAPRTDQKELDSFPWKLRLSDVSCYTLEIKSTAKDKSHRSQLKSQTYATPRTVLEMVTTTITLSVVTKSLQNKTVTAKKEQKHPEASAEQETVKYFSTGLDFKPSTLREFVRGPARRRKTNLEQSETSPESSPTVTKGPVVSLGVHLHADTPPLIVRLDHDQVHIVSATLHCFKHILSLLRRSSDSVQTQSFTPQTGSHRSLIRSVSEVDEARTRSDETNTENRSELISIFESQSAQDLSSKLKTFFWFQWVVSRATLIVATSHAKLAFDIDDIISTIDVQSHYNQLRIKVASASVRHYERVGDDEWTAGVLGGRVLEAREPSNAREDNHFLSITVTQAQISNLPSSWREELHPKLLENKTSSDTMWEIYATLAPLEVVLQPTVVDHIIALVHEMAPRSFCPQQPPTETSNPSSWQWPFCYVTAGGLRLLLTCEGEDTDLDDTIMFVIGKISVNPHPENPICRRAVNSSTDSGWATNSTEYEGRQYEVIIKNVAVRSAQFRQIVNQEVSEAEILKGTGGENPALKWSQPTIAPVITPILHSVDIGCVLAPALYSSNALVCGPAVEFNLVSDCAMELSVDQLDLLRRLISDIQDSIQDSNELSMQLNEIKNHSCPYANILSENEQNDSNNTSSDTSFTEDIIRYQEYAKATAADSGVDTTSQSTFKSGRLVDEPPALAKKSVSVGFAEQISDASEFLEVYVTMGTIDLSLYTKDNSNPEIVALRPPVVERHVDPIPLLEVVIHNSQESSKRDDEESQGGSKSNVESIPNIDGKSKLEHNNEIMPLARKCEGNLPLLHLTLQQPNLYYWRKKAQRSLQVSLFDAWFGLGMGNNDGQWNAVLLSTAKGSSDPVTDIPPALATMKIMVPSSGFMGSSSNSNSKGSIRIDIERPVRVDVCTDRFRRIKGIINLINKQMPASPSKQNVETSTLETPLLYKMRRFLSIEGIETVTVLTSQLVLLSSEYSVGCNATTFQVAVGSRPERMVVRSSVTALVVGVGPTDRRHPVLQPLMMGFEIDAHWEAWRRTEGGMSAREPTVRIGIELDVVIVDLKPEDLVTLKRIQKALAKISETKEEPTTTSNINASNINACEECEQTSNVDRPSSMCSIDTINSTETSDHYYKDDLRTGAFKIVSGGQLPMAYQVMLHGTGVSWRYPHPRAITRLIVFPLPGLDNDIPCVLEFYIPTLGKWEIHSHFSLPVGEPRELQLQVTPPETVFAQIWRFRINDDKEKELPYEFRLHKFMPRNDPLLTDLSPEPQANVSSPSGVTAEQLSGVIRVDSYFAPRLLSKTHIFLRASNIEVHIHNSLPFLTSNARVLEGYYVSRPLMRSHRVVTLFAKAVTSHAELGSPTGTSLLLDTRLSVDILECDTGTMDHLVFEFPAQIAASIPPGSVQTARVRAVLGVLRVRLHVPRLKVIQALTKDWRQAIDRYRNETPVEPTVELETKSIRHRRDYAEAMEEALEGRVSLWVHNSCSAALRMGQEGTDEVVPLGPGTRLAYRWRNPTAPKMLRLSLAGPTADWHWSNSIPFTLGNHRIRLEDADRLSGKGPGSGVFIHAAVKGKGARLRLHLSGRLVLANMLRFDLLYKVRARCSDSNQLSTICSGEILSEDIGTSVLCGEDSDMMLKIKFVSPDTGWSGDIPLKECPKENVPWLVKVPSQGRVPFIAVWCRVIKARSDGRILATVWPLYVLRSHLPLDTDVMIKTESGISISESNPDAESPPLVQSAPGRGTSVHLLAPGTTSARHSLLFQYRNIECPVTRDAVPLHYGVPDTSVFEKRGPACANIDKIIEDIVKWVDNSGRNSKSEWPYSIVSKQWYGLWQPALLQPRSDVKVRYQAVRAGGGCCLELQLTPVVLLCNAAPIALTLRAYDAAPLCKIEPGTVIAPPSTVVKKPFFMSVEMGRETFVSGQMQISKEEPGLYGAPPPGQVALDHSLEFAIQCNQKVALMTMYYQFIKEINVLGVNSTFELLNRLDHKLMVSAIAIPNEINDDLVLQPKTFKIADPTKSIHGLQLCRFWLQSRWRGSDPSELRLYLCLALPSEQYPAHTPVPIKLGSTAVRRSVALVDGNNESIPVVVSQMKHEDRWIISVAPDECPQFLVHNRTRHTLAVAQPMMSADEPSTSAVPATPECSGTSWWCIVRPQAAIHYSTPSHNGRYPPPPCNALNNKPEIPFLTFAIVHDEDSKEWCQPAAMTDGEQLVQLPGNITIKLRVHTHPHSTHIELQNVDQDDISASDIRRRLFGAFASDVSYATHESMIDADELSIPQNLDRVGGDVKLLDQTLVKEHSSDSSPIPWDSEGRSNPVRYNHLISVATVTVEHRDESPDNADEASTVELKRLSEGKVNIGVSSPQESAYVNCEQKNNDWDETGRVWPQTERLRSVITGVILEIATSVDALPLVAIHADRMAVLMLTDTKQTKTTISISNIQIDNLQYETGQYDFAVIACTRSDPIPEVRRPPLWNMFSEEETFNINQSNARVLVKLQHDNWNVLTRNYRELTELDFHVGPLALYIEDAYVTALVDLSRSAQSSDNISEGTSLLAEERSLQVPLRLRHLSIRPLDLTLTLHTAVRMYIALDQSPLRLSAFEIRDMMTSSERLTHALTVHYLSAAILGAGWVVGGLELLGAPGALAARVGNATGGVRGVASAAVAALLKSLSAWAGSLARNLDLLAGDEEHARRAAAARRRPPPSLLAGLVAGITNFAINILGAVGGLAHHPLVGVAVGESESGATALRRGLLGALTKPLSATADLVAYAGHGLLTQTGWDPVPQPRAPIRSNETSSQRGWRRDCVRWSFRLAELSALSGFEALLDNAPLQLLLTHKFLVVADPETEHIVEMIDFRFCTLEPYQGPVIKLIVTQRRQSKVLESRAIDEDDEFQISAAAMARVARYTGQEGAPTSESRVLSLIPTLGKSYALHAALATLLNHNTHSHFQLL